MLARFIAARAATMAVIVNRAVERGEVPPGTDAAEVIQIVMARSTTGCSPPENRSALPRLTTGRAGWHYVGPPS
jgi:hypothetical protein